MKRGGGGPHHASILFQSEYLPVVLLVHLPDHVLGVVEKRRPKVYGFRPKRLARRTVRFREIETRAEYLIGDRVEINTPRLTQAFQAGKNIGFEKIGPSHMHKSTPGHAQRGALPSCNHSGYHKLLQPLEPMESSPICRRSRPRRGRCRPSSMRGGTGVSRRCGITVRGGAKAAIAGCPWPKPDGAKPTRGRRSLRPKGNSGDWRPEAPGARAEAGCHRRPKRAARTIARSFGLRTAPPFSSA